MRIVIAEDSVLLREGIAELLARVGHEVVAQVGEAGSLLAAVHEHRPDLAIVDVRMPPDYTDEGLRAAVRLRSERSAVGVLVLSQYVEHTHAAELLESADGGVGYLLKDRIGDVSDLVSALDEVASGGTVVDPEVVRQLLARRRGRSRLTALTPREREVLSHMAEGKNNAAIAAALTITGSAVARHINSMFAKLGLTEDEGHHHRVAAVIMYLRGD